MADNTTLNAGVGGDLMRTEDVGGGVKVPAYKLHLGAAGADGGPIANSTADGVAGGSAFMCNPALWNGATLDRARAVSGDAMAATGLQAGALMAFNGATWDRARSATADGLASTGVLAGADFLFNGTTLDRTRSNSAANSTTMLTPSPITGVQMNSAPAGWTKTNTPAATAQATTTIAAGAAGVRHICTSITASLAAVGTASGLMTVNLRDGASGAGTVLWSGVISVPVNSSQAITIAGIAIPGTAATAMTLEFAAGGAAATVESVTMTGYDVN